jgi:CheY-like chemotaxis protein
MFNQGTSGSIIYDTGGEMKGKVVVVDDESIIGKLLSFQLTQAGFEPVFYEDPRVALENISRIKPKVIISDIEMPGMDGFEFHNELRNNPSTSGIPFIFLTARTGSANELEGLQVGADDYISKPPIPEILVERMERAMERAERARSYKTRADFSGNLTQMSLNDVVQIVEANHKSGELYIFDRRGDNIGKVTFREGNLINARMDDFKGEEAFYSLMSVTEGYIEFYDRKSEEEKEIELTNMCAMLNASRLIDDGKYLHSRAPNLGVWLFLKAGEIPPEISERAGQERVDKILSLIKEKLTISEILDNREMTCIRTASIIADLLVAGAVEISENKPEHFLLQVREKPDILNPEVTGLLKQLEKEASTGLVRINGGKKKAGIFVKNGQILNAFHGSVNGKKALYRILEYREGKPVFQPQRVFTNREINESLERLFEDAQREIEIMKKVNTSTFEHMVRIRPDSLKTLSGVNIQILEMMTPLVYQHGIIKDIIDACRLTDLQVYKCLVYLVKKGVLVFEKNPRDQ